MAKLDQVWGYEVVQESDLREYWATLKVGSGTKLLCKHCGEGLKRGYRILDMGLLDGEIMVVVQNWCRRVLLVTLGEGEWYTTMAKGVLWVRMGVGGY